LPDTFGGFNLQTSGFARTIQEQIIRNVIDLLRTGLEFTPQGSVIKAVQKPGGSGVYRLTNWTDVEPDLTELSETQPPAPLFLAGDDLEFSAKLIGSFFPVTWLASIEAGESLVAQAVSKISRMAAEAYDKIAQTAYDAEASTPDLFGGTGNDAIGEVGSGDCLDANLCVSILTALRSQDIKPLPDGTYHVVGHPQAFDPMLRAMVNGTIPGANFGQVGDLQKGELGRVMGLSFRDTTRGTFLAGAGLASNDLAVLHVIGAQSLALSEVAGNFAAIVRQSVGTDDPLGQLVATIGYKAFAGAKVVSIANRSDGDGNAEPATKRSLCVVVSPDAPSPSA
jgi:hypothetical protein